MSSTTTQTLDHTTHNEKVTSAIGNDSNLQFTQTNDPIIQDRSHHNNDQTSHDQQTIRRKLVVVGDGACGKTSLLVAYKDDRFDNDYVPTVFENTHAAVPVENRTVDLALWDTAGQEDYDRLRPLSYPDSNVILICFAIDNHESLLNVQRKWIHELRRYCPTVPILLVGCKSDLRLSPNASRSRSQTDSIMSSLSTNIITSTSQTDLEHVPSLGNVSTSSQMSLDLVSVSLARTMAEKIGAVTYIECSAKSRSNVNAVFAQAARASLTQQSLTNKEAMGNAPKKSRKRCSIL